MGVGWGCRSGPGISMATGGGGEQTVMNGILLERGGRGGAQSDCDTGWGKWRDKRCRVGCREMEECFGMPVWGMEAGLTHLGLRGVCCEGASKQCGDREEHKVHKRLSKREFLTLQVRGVLKGEG